MIEALIVIVPLIAFLTGAIFGYRRTGSRQWVSLGCAVAGVLATSGVCYLFSLTKTGGYLAGIVGAVMAMIALVMVGAIPAGALIRIVHEQISRQTSRMTALSAVDAGVMGLLCAAMVALSAME